MNKFQVTKFWEEIFSGDISQKLIIVQFFCLYQWQNSRLDEQQYVLITQMAQSFGVDGMPLFFFKILESLRL